MKLSEECIEAIEVHEECYYQDYGANRNINIRSTFMVGATEALTTPSIYEKAGLISLEEVDEFLKWRNNTCYYSITLKGWCIFNVVSTTSLTTAQLFQIYQQQKEK